MPPPGGQEISKSAAGIGEAQHRGAAFPDSELASGVNARRRRAIKKTVDTGRMDARRRVSSRPGSGRELCDLVNREFGQDELR
jgi:hypothetical protein